ncbi:AAA family ATPase [Nonomuraea mesophila]|uniref:AAA family ATPase n=1 Tax=Nonomuraea mesophila TaxID=2530382 RepID=UPI00140AA361|nr:AAA family ATPase [Nonomuraea mesophila]
MTDLHIPDVDTEHDTLGAALAYAKAGWYVLPVNRQTKHAGSVLGKGWPAKTSRDPETIIAWFAGADHALALHVGRSGAIAFDVDRPAELPDLLRAVLLTVPGPMQSTRVDDPERGHYLYAAPCDRALGNSAGTLGRTWGEVRGRNGIIVVAPSTHEKAAEGGRYAWERTGMLPELPDVLADALPDATDATDAATDAEVSAFLKTHQGGARPELLTGVLHRFDAAVRAGESRHNAMLTAAAWAMREAAAGLYPAVEAAHRLSTAFAAVMSVSRDGSERVLAPGQARAEFGGILAWAVAQTVFADAAEVRQAVDERAPRGEFDGLLLERPQTPPSAVEQPATPRAEHHTAAAVEQPVEQPEADELARLAFEREVAHELRKLRVREEAARLARKQRQAAAPRPVIVPLDEFLSVPDEPVAYRIDRLWPKGGRVVLAAQYKAGKTTLVGNLVRSLVDGDPFLGAHTVEPFAGRVVLLDDELDETMVRRWLREQHIANAGAAAVVSLRGRLSSFDLLDPETRSEWAAALRQAGATVVVLDCLAPILDALGLSEDKEAGRFLVAFDEMLKEAGVSEAVLVHHMGHTGERARGASRLRDWPDVEWRLVREKNDDGESEPNAPRYFSAYGRDVDVAESLLAFDAPTRRLTLAGGSRKDSAADKTLRAVVDHLGLAPGQSQRQIEAAFKDTEHNRAAVRGALRRGVANGVLGTTPGRSGGSAYHVKDVSKLATSAPAILKRDDFSDLVNSVSAGQPSAPSAPSTFASISKDHDISAESAPDARRTETAGHSASAPSAPECASAPAASAPVRPPKGGWRTGAHSAAEPPPGVPPQATNGRRWEPTAPCQGCGETMVLLTPGQTHHPLCEQPR